MTDPEKENDGIDEFEAILMFNALEPDFGPRQQTLIDAVTYRNQHGPELTEADRELMEHLFDILNIAKP